MPIGRIAVNCAPLIDMGSIIMIDMVMMMMRMMRMMMTAMI